MPRAFPYVCVPPYPEQFSEAAPVEQALLWLTPSPAPSPPPTPPVPVVWPPPPPPPATTTRVARDAAVAQALGPETVPDDARPVSVAVDAEYEIVLAVALTAVNTKVPSSPSPTPATMTLLPTLNP